MTGSIMALSVATGAFVATHFLLSAALFRRPIARLLGEWGFKGAYAIVALATFTWMIMAFQSAPYVELFEPGTALRHASLTLMLIAAFFVVAGYTTPNPGVMGMETIGLRAGAQGVLKITRHPVMWGVAIWGLSHVLANGHLAALIFFGAMIVLAIGGAAHIDAKRRVSHDAAWKAYEDETSFIPLAAILMGKTKVEKGEVRWWQTLLTVALYIGMLASHAWMGRDVFPMALF